MKKETKFEKKTEAINIFIKDGKEERHLSLEDLGMIKEKFRGVANQHVYFEHLAKANWLGKIVLRIKWFIKKF